MNATADTTPIVAPHKSSSRLFIPLFSGNLAIFTVGNGLLPLLPIFAGQLGADTASTGYYLATTYLALTVGTLLAGWVSDKLQRRKTGLIIAGGLIVPAAWITGQTASLSWLAIFSALIFSLIGFTLTLTSILAGMYAREIERGRIFGLLGLTVAMGALIGGSTFGVLADNYGYKGLFTVIAAVLIVLPFTGLLLEDRVVTKRVSELRPSSQPLRFRAAFPVFLLSSVLAWIVRFEGSLGTSLTMRGLGFSSTAIASTTAIAGAVGLAFSPVLGSLSDRFGRKRPLVSCYLAVVVSMLVLTIASSLWEFWVASSLLALFAYAGGGLGSALVADMVDSGSLGRGLSFFTSTTWIGGVIGFAVTGLAFHNLGATTTFYPGASVIFLATLALVIALRTKR